MRVIQLLRGPAWLAGLLPVLLCGVCLAASEDDGWSPVRAVEGVEVFARPTESGFSTHRAEALVCADMMALEAFVEDTSRFRDWVPYTREVALLDKGTHDVTYYVRTTTPWPMRDRDMIYRLSRIVHPGPGIRIAVVGLPDHLDRIPSVERMREATGEWWLRPTDGALRVKYELYVNPGPVPRFFANQRLASAVGKTLANLARQFPCPRSAGPADPATHRSTGNSVSALPWASEQ